MNRLVYLFELDSAKTSRHDAEKAEKAIFNEIIKKGNRVVLSMNQFVDSKIMTTAVNDEKGFKYVKRLFESGMLKVSLFADVYSVSQYVQESVDRALAKGGDCYVFNTLPIKCDERELLLEVKNALKYSDLSGINRLLDIEFMELRREEDLEKRSEIIANIRRLKTVVRFLTLVLKLGNTKGTTSPKATEGRSFLEFMNEAMSTLKSASFRRRDVNGCKDAVYDKLCGVVDYFDAENMSDKQRNRRSNWIKQLTADGKEDAVTAFAVEIVNMCYNYAVQDTISGVSKQYDDDNFAETFRFDFIRRVNNYWLQLEKGKFITGYYDSSKGQRSIFIKEWKNAVSVALSSSERGTVETVMPEDKFAEKRSWYIYLLKKFGISLGYTAAYALAYCLVGFLINLIIVALGAPTVGLIVANLLAGIVLVVGSVVLPTYTVIPAVWDTALGVVRNAKNLFNALFKKYAFSDKK